jgi:hypothetical protein
MQSSIIKISIALLPFLPTSQAHPPSRLSHSNKLGRLLVVPPKGHHHGPNNSICTEENMAVHREWYVTVSQLFRIAVLTHIL